MSPRQDFGTMCLHPFDLTFYCRKMVWSQSDVSSTSRINTWMVAVIHSYCTCVYISIMSKQMELNKYQGIPWETRHIQRYSNRLWKIWKPLAQGFLQSLAWSLWSRVFSPEIFMELLFSFQNKRNVLGDVWFSTFNWVLLILFGILFIHFLWFHREKRPGIKRNIARCCNHWFQVALKLEKDLLLDVRICGDDTVE